MKVTEIMAKDVPVVRPTDTVETIARIILERHVDAVPVVDERGGPIGIVTKTDLFVRSKVFPFTQDGLPAIFDQWVDTVNLDEVYKGVRNYQAKDVMTQDVVCAGTDEEVGDVARYMAEHGMKQMPVVQDGTIVGMVSRTSVISLLVPEIDSA